MTNTRIGFIGCGTWATKKYIQYLKGMHEVSVLCISDLKFPEEQANIQIHLPNVRFYDNYIEMCSIESLDGVIVSLPTGLHYSATKYALNSGIPTLVDKPLCSNYEQAKELVEIAMTKNLTLAVSSQRRSQEGYKIIQDLVRNGKFGSILWIQTEFVHANTPNWDKTWRNSPDLAGGRGVLLDTGYHLVDLVLQILDGELPDSFYVVKSNRNYEVDMDAEAILQFSNGTRATVFVSRSTPKGYDIERLSLLGTHGYALVEVIELAGEKSSRLLYNVNGKNVIQKELSSETKIYPLRDFLAHLKGSPLPEVWNASTTLKTLSLIDKLYEVAISFYD